MQHHDEAIRRYVARIAEDPEVLGLLVTGSVGRGNERPDSDIDLYQVVTEEAYERALAEDRVMFVDREGTGYDHGYYDVKLATLDYLDDAADRGDDPVRDSLAISRVVYSRVDDLEQRVERAATVPEAQWAERLDAFLAEARLHGGYFLRQALERGEPLLTHHAALHLAMAVARALMALNRVTYAGPKYLASTVAALERKPDGIDEALVALVERPSIETGEEVMRLLDSAVDWPPLDDRTLSTFIRGSELAWRTRTKPPEYS